MNDQSMVDDIILQLVDEVNTLYPETRKAEAKRRLEDMWDGIYPKDRFPYVACTGPLEQPVLPEDVHPWDKELVAQLCGLRDHAVWQDDLYPALSPGVRQVIIPSWFGCVEELASSSLRVKPVVNRPEDAYALPELGFPGSTAGGEMLDKMRLWRKKTQGKLSFYEADMQGPFSVASQVWGIQDFMMAVYDSPDAVHHLLDRSTEAILEFYRLMDEATDGDMIPFHCMPNIWYPRRKGVAVSEDLEAVVSPGIVREFMRPYLERIARAYGGVFTHSCGSINGVVKELMDVAGIVGINFSSTETDLPEIMKKRRDGVAIVTHNSPVNRPDLPMRGGVDHARHFGEVFRCHGANGVCMIIPFDRTLDQKTDEPMILQALKV